MASSVFTTMSRFYICGIIRFANSKFSCRACVRADLKFPATYCITKFRLKSCSISSVNSLSSFLMLLKMICRTLHVVYWNFMLVSDRFWIIPDISSYVS